eukprot:TRINITY_DN41699_c0_g1_i1.p1 TRINITY_DN41699_c0_g1~~TRINITY_DN41699_c0_g1_i1.p1  ORF type:complete len:679 (-),score=242.49 TRINITY_DN41699_c0_g1_i1:131-2167(-)
MKYAWAAALFATAATRGANGEQDINKVIEMLQGMSKTLEDEVEADKKVDTDMQAWCKSNKDDQKRSIKEATESKIPSLTAEQTSGKLESARLVVEIKNQETTKGKATLSLESATEQRKTKKESHETMATEMKENIESLDKAKKILTAKKTDPTSFLAAKGSPEETAVETVHKLQSKYQDLLLGIITPHQKELVLQAQASFVTKGASSSSGPSFDSIVGIVGEMHSTFERHLKEAEEAEEKATSTFEGLETAKKSEIQAAEETILSKETQKAAAEQRQAEAQEDMKNVKDELKAAETFLEEINTRCDNHEEDYSSRSKTRLDEISTISKAVKILTEQKDTLSRTLDQEAASFLQVDSVNDKASKILQEVAAKTSDPKIAALAAVARDTNAADKFKRVKGAIVKMIQQLEVEKKKEAEKKVTCTNDLEQNSADTKKYTEEKGKVEDVAKGLEASIEELKKSAKETQSEIEELEKDLKEAGVSRKEEADVFEKTVSDQLQTQKALNEAIFTLKRTYASAAQALLQQSAKMVDIKPAKKSTAALLQQDPAPEFSDYKKQDGNGVIDLLTHLVEDAKALEKSARETEASAKQSYQAFKIKANTSIMTKKRAIIDKESDAGKANKALLGARDDIEASENMLKTLKDTLKALTKECDTFLEQFDVRQKGFSTEIDALEQAKGFLK